MKKRMIVVLLGLVALASCKESKVDSSSSSSPTEETRYFLTGDLELRTQNRVELLKQGDTYTYGNVKLKRGNSFSIQSDDGSVGFSALQESTGFSEGENNYIRVLNEGIYNLSLDVSSNPKLSLTKTDSTYSSVTLVRKDGESYPFTKNEDFTFTLDDVNLRYRDQFYIKMDEERLSFNALYYNDVYFDALRFKDNEAYVVQKGTFDFTLDFKNENPLLCTSSNFTMPQQIPQNAAEYEVFASSFKNQFTQSGSELNYTYKVFDDGQETTTSGKSVLEHFNENEYYRVEKSSSADSYSVVNNNYITSTNYYELKGSFDADKSYTKDVTPLVTGYLLGEQVASASDDTTVKKPKKYITEEKAREKLLSPIASKDTDVKGYLLNVLRQDHVLSSNKINEAEYLSKLQLDIQYNDTYGDGLKVLAKNIEIPSDKKNIAFINEVEFYTDNEGHLTNGSYKLTSYGTSTTAYSGGQVVDDSGSFVATNDMTPTKVEVHEFTYAYDERKHVDDDNLYLPPSSYIATSISFLSSDTLTLAKGATLDYEQYKPADIAPSNALDLANFQVVEYDSSFLSQNYVETSFTCSKRGDTSVKIGTLYNDVEATLKLTISYDYSSSLPYNMFSIKTTDDFSTTFGNSTIYVGSTYHLKAVCENNKFDPYCKVESSDSESLKIENLDSEEDQRKNEGAYFDLKVEKVPTADVTLTVTSLVSQYQNKSSEIKISKSKISEQVTKKTFANTYYASNKNILKLTEDGKGTAESHRESGKVDKTINFDWDFELSGSTITITATGDNLKSSVSLGIKTKTLSSDILYYYIESSSSSGFSFEDNEGNKCDFPQKVHPAWSYFETLTDMTSTGGMKLKRKELIVSSSSYDPTVSSVMTLQNSDDSKTIDFPWAIPTSSYGNSANGSISLYDDAFKINGEHPSSTWNYTIEIEELAATTLKLKLKGFSAAGFNDGSYVFTQVAA